MSINSDIIEENVIFNVKTKVTMYKRGGNKCVDSHLTLFFSFCKF